MDSSSSSSKLEEAKVYILFVWNKGKPAREKNNL